MEDEFLEIAKQFLYMVSQEIEPYVSDETYIEDAPYRVTLFAPEHFQFAKYGRGPGKQPPVSKILDFVKKKGIIFENSTQEGTAWAIAKSISKKGTKGYTPNPPNAFQEAINKHLKDYADEMSKHLLTVAEREANNIYLKTFPKTQKI